MAVSGPGIFPAYIGVGYIIGPRLAALNFAGGVLAWGLFAPLLMFFLGPQLIPTFYGPGVAAADVSWIDMVTNVWKFIIRPIAVGGMLVGAGYTLYRMRKNLAAGIKRSLGDVKKAAGQSESVSRIEKDLNIKVVLGGTGPDLRPDGLHLQGLRRRLAAGHRRGRGHGRGRILLRRRLGEPRRDDRRVEQPDLRPDPLHADHRRPADGRHRGTGMSGVAAVLGVAAVVCVSSAVAGEMLQDLKVGHILGGTPYKMQIGNIFGILVASLVMYFPLMLLNGAFTFGSKDLPAPQAGLMAALSKGIVGGEMAWPLVIVGMLMGFAFILVQVKSPMLVAVGMYLPLETTFAIFVGGMIKGLVDKAMAKRKFNAAQTARATNVGILLAAGLIAGEGLMGLVRAAWKFFFLQNIISFDIPALFKDGKYFGVVDLYVGGLAVLVLIGLYLIKVPLKNAGAADEPPPPSAVI